MKTVISSSWKHLFVLVTVALLAAACGGDEVGENQNQQEEVPPDDPDGPDISVVSVEASPTDVFVGQRVAVDVLLINEGDRPGEVTITLEVDGAAHLSQERFVPAADPDSADDSPGELSAELGFVPDAAGEYELSVNGVGAGSVAVTAPESDIQVVSAGISVEGDTETVTVGDLVVAFAHVQNLGDADGEVELRLEVDGDAVVEREAFVAAPGLGGDPAQTEHLEEFDWTFESAGQFDLTVNGVDAGSIDVVSIPDVAIDQPTNEPHEFFVVQGYEEGQGWYVEIDFVGSAQDEVDGTLTAGALQWTTTADEDGNGTATTRTLGEGADLTARLYMNDEECGAIADHHIELRATNSAGLVAMATHRVVVQMGMC